MGLKGAGGENQGLEGPPSLPRWGGEGRRRDNAYHVMETQGVGWEAACPQETPSSIQDITPGLSYGLSIAHEIAPGSSVVDTHRGPRRTLVIAQV